MPFGYGGGFAQQDPQNPTAAAFGQQQQLGLQKDQLSNQKDFQKKQLYLQIAGLLLGGAQTGGGIAGLLAK